MSSVVKSMLLMLMFLGRPVKKLISPKLEPFEKTFREVNYTSLLF